MQKLKNKFPIQTDTNRLAIIGEAPSQDDYIKSEIFTSKGAGFLKRILLAIGANPERCFFGNLVQERPPHGDFDSLNWSSDHVQSGLFNLKQDLNSFRPNCCLLLGRNVLRAFGYDQAIQNYRGTIFHSPTFNFKAVATYHPKAVLRNYTWQPFLRFDCFRAFQQSTYPELRLPERSHLTNPTASEIVTLLQEIRTQKLRIAFDLEGYPDFRGVTCLSIATSALTTFIIPFRNFDGSSNFSIEEETDIWYELCRVLADPDVKKTAQNAMYELFVFAYRHQIIIRGLDDDTMTKHWELFCEFPKNLGLQTSIYTEEPYYKDERTIPDNDTHFLYCCKDSAVTYEINEKQETQLSKNPKAYKHYRFNVNILQPYLYMQLRGCKLDLDRVRYHKERIWKKITEQQAIVNELTGRHFNVKSSKQKAEYLYDELHLPPQYKGVGGQKKITTDFEAICKLYIKHDITALLEIVKLVKLRTRFSDIHKLTAFGDGRIRCNYNPVGTDTGRLSSSSTSVFGYTYDPKITLHRTTGLPQLTYKKGVDYLGTNIQNQHKSLRDCFTTDTNEHDFFQYDLAGADAWTVAADLAALGKPQMLNHLQKGIKPSMVIVFLLDYGAEVYRWSDEVLKQKCKAFDKTEWRYLCAKRCQHGTNYGMAKELLASVLLKDSVDGWIQKFIKGEVAEKQFLTIHPYEVQRYQRLYSEYYGLELRSQFIERQLSDYGYLDCASGHRRQFFTIRNRNQIDSSTLRAALSHEPQANTTYATNAALYNLFNDLENRTQRGNLRVEPLLMIHDALAGQTLKSNRNFAISKFQTWFNTPLIIHGIDINIPVDGEWGPNWQQLEELK